MKMKENILLFIIKIPSNISICFSVYLHFKIEKSYDHKTN
jgi:hypothetical protein